MSPYYLSFLRIVIAEMQNVVYGQYLPQILGPETMNTENLRIDGPSAYNVGTDPSIINAFATAAFRFGHSQIRNMVKIKDIITSIETRYRYFTIFLLVQYTCICLNNFFINLTRLKDNFFVPDIFETQMEAVLNGMIADQSESVDPNVASDITEGLFANIGFPGSDLIARNIQRGRDHGLPGYNEYREVIIVNYS